MTATSPEEAGHLEGSELDGSAREHRFVVAPETSRRLATDHLVFTMTRKLTIFIWVAMFAGMMLVLAGLAILNANIVPLIAGGLIFVILFGLLTFVNWRTSIRQLEAINPVGSELVMEFTDTELRGRGSQSSGNVLYAALDRMVVRRGTVMLRVRGTAIYSVYPIELFPEDERRRLAASIAP